MKRFSPIACVLLLIALVMAVGSATFLGPCVHEDGSFGSCHWAGRAMLGVGCALAAQAVLALLQKEGAARAAAFLGMVPTAALGALIPGALIDLCRMATMRCRAVMQPAMLLLSVFAAMLALAGWLLERGLAKRGA